MALSSGAPDFFKRAFGDTAADFERILMLPHDFTFNREWYERFDEKQELHEYHEVAKALDESDRIALDPPLVSSTLERSHCYPKLPRTSA